MGGSLLDWAREERRKGEAACCSSDYGQGDWEIAISPFSLLYFLQQRRAHLGRRRGVPRRVLSPARGLFHKIRIPKTPHKSRFGNTDKFEWLLDSAFPKPDYLTLRIHNQGMWILWNRPPVPIFGTAFVALPEKAYPSSWAKHLALSSHSWWATYFFLEGKKLTRHPRAPPGRKEGRKERGKPSQGRDDQRCYSPPRRAARWKALERLRLCNERQPLSLIFLKSLLVALTKMGKCTLNLIFLCTNKMEGRILRWDVRCETVAFWISSLGRRDCMGNVR